MIATVVDDENPRRDVSLTVVPINRRRRGRLCDPQSFIDLLLKPPDESSGLRVGNSPARNARATERRQPREAPHIQRRSSVPRKSMSQALPRLERELHTSVVTPVILPCSNSSITSRVWCHQLVLPKEAPRSFDDGWCAAGLHCECTPRSAASLSQLFRWSSARTDR